MNPPPADLLTEQEAERISLAATTVFKPRTPIDTRKLFAGRWNQLTNVNDAVNQTGLHVVIYGERGVGKTSLANIIRPVLHAFDTPVDAPPEEFNESRPVVKVNANNQDTFGTLWHRATSEITIAIERKPHVFATETETKTISVSSSLPEPVDIDSVRRLLAQLSNAVFIFDEYDRLPLSETRHFTDLIKSLSDFSVQATVILVGVSDTVDTLLADHQSIARAIIQVHMPRMTEEELRGILTTAEKELSVGFGDDAARQIVLMSQGLPHYTHLVGLESVRRACKDQSRLVNVGHVHSGLLHAVRGAQQSILSKYESATHSAHRETLYKPTLLACAIAATKSKLDQGYFQPADIVEPLSAILKRATDVSMFNKHLADFCEPKRAQILERTGQPRAYRYRFRDPLVPPYVIMKSIALELITEVEFEQLTNLSTESHK